MTEPTTLTEAIAGIDGGRLADASARSHDACLRAADAVLDFLAAHVEKPEMVEAMATGLAIEAWVVGGFPWEKLTGGEREVYRRYARAANTALIESLRGAR